MSMPSTLDWLRERDDRALAALLRARPDLTVPAPGDLTVLAGRLNTGPSVWRAMESLNQFHIQVLQALAVLGADRHAVPADDLRTLLGAAVPNRALDDAVEKLEGLALIRGTTRIQMPSAVLAVLGPYPAGLGSPGAMTVQEAEAALVGLDPAARGLLERLASGVPRGTTDSRSAVGAAVKELVGRRLLRRIDTDTVELPREVGLALRGDEPLGTIRVQPPPDTAVDHGVAKVDGTGGGQSLATVDRIGRLIDAIGQNPPPALKSGGLGIRELRRLSKAMGTDDHITAMDVEILAAAGLIAAADSRGRMAESWTPTADADDFLASPDESAWVQIAAVWLDLRRNPSRVGGRDASDKVLNALSPELSWIRGPAERRFVLSALAELPAGSGLDEQALSARLGWRSPLRPAEQREAVLRSTIAEATALGVVAFTALTTAGRELLAGSTAGAEAALIAALPDPVDTVMVQADLTVVAPGRLVPALAARLGQVADVESAGSATVYRVTPQSIRRALDAGATTAELHELFDAHSVTGVPQSLDYLIDDVGRRYGVLRLGRATTYLRSDDPALVDQAVTEAAALGIALRRLAPTVAISTVGTQELMTQLRTGGLVPAAEDESGAVLDLRTPPHRTKQAAPQYQHWREPPQLSQEQLDSLISRMRSADRTGALYSHGDVQPSGDTLGVLRAAVDHRKPLWIGYVDADGGTTHRMIEPVALSSGAVVAYDRLRGSVRTFVLHRITGVRAVTDEEDVVEPDRDETDRPERTGTEPGRSEIDRTDADITGAAPTPGLGTDGGGSDGSGSDGSGSEGSGSDGDSSDFDGSASDGSKRDGSASDGSKRDGSASGAGSSGAGGATTVAAQARSPEPTDANPAPDRRAPR